MSIQLNVPDMSCGHCVGVITKAVRQVAPNASVSTDLASHRVTVDGAAEAEEVRKAIVDAGYDAQIA